MKTVSIELYKFDELSDESKEIAVNEYLSAGDFYHWGSDNEATLKAFENLFPVTATNWEYSYQNVINYTLDPVDYDEVWEFTGIRLQKWLVNNYWHDLFKPKFIYKVLDGKSKSKHSKCQWDNCCVLTGYCVDDDILKPIYDFLKTPDNSTLEDLLYDCLQSWIFACNQEYEACQEFDYVAENLEINEYDFTVDGKFY